MNSKTGKEKNLKLNVLSTNAAGLKHKANDLKNKISYFESAIFAVQETQYRKKGNFKMDNFVIFEAIRKNKEKGGSMLGIDMNLQPVLVNEYSETFELIVVEIQVGNTSMSKSDDWLYRALE